MKLKYVHLVLLILILALALSLRLAFLSQESLWTDEEYSLRHAKAESFSQVAAGVSVTEAAPPGYYWLLHYWIKIFGSSEGVLRMPSVILGTLSVIMLYWLSKLFFSTFTSLLSSLFLATSMLQVLYSQDARLYALFGFLSLLSTFFFAKSYVKNESSHFRNFYVALYSLSMLFSLYTNYLSFFMILIFTLFFLWDWRRYKKYFQEWLLINAILAILCLPLVLIVKSQFFYLGTNAGLTFIKFGVPVFISKLGLFIFALPAMLVAAFLSLGIILKKKLISIFSKLTFNTFLFFILLVSFLGVYLVLTLKPLSLMGMPIFQKPITHSYFLIRHSFFLAPVFYLLLARSIEKFPKKMAMLSIALVMVVNAFALTEYYGSITKPQWREAVAFMQEHDLSLGSSLILLDKGGSSHVALFDYYFSQANHYFTQYYFTQAGDGFVSAGINAEKPEIFRLTKFPRGKEMVKAEDNEVLEIARASGSFWLVLSKNKETGDYYKKLLDAHFTLIRSAEFYEVKVYQYRKRH